MYGFGDDQNPYSESVDLLEDLVIEYISEMVLDLLMNEHLFVPDMHIFLVRFRHAACLS